MRAADLARMSAELTATVAASRQATPPWVAPVLADFRWEESVLAFDQSLSHCGWLLFVIRHGRVIVYDRGTVSPQTGATGFVSSWDKARQLRAALTEIVALAPGVRHIVYENPAVRGHRLESSLLAGQVLYELTGDRGHHISAQHACKVLCGAPLRSQDRKKAIRLSVARYIPGSETRQWNEHQRDAAALGLTHLYDLRQAA